MSRALFVTESRGWSGGAKQLISLAEGLRARKWDVLLACPEDGQTFAKAREKGIETIHFVPRQDYDVPSAWRLAKMCMLRDVDVLHAHHPRAHAVALMSTFFLKKPPVFLVSRRVSFKIPGNPFSRFKYTSDHIDAYVAVAESIRQILIEAGVRPERVATIRSGVDVAQFSPRPRDPALAAELGLPPGVPVVGLIANYSEWKGQAVLVEAAGRLKRQGARAVYLFAGRDTQSPELLAKAKAAGLGEEDAKFLGFREDVPRLLPLLDVSVNVSVAGEGISGALRESLAMGIPVAASDIGGNKELVRDGETGMVFKAGDPDALAKALSVFIKDPAAGKRMAETGRKWVGENLSTEKMVSATEALYHKLLAGKRGENR
ncbi:MAG: glycosyltransferase family 4 protein [Elusimicrobia bacterium]|nr:glycosyltransferase family 4 protein [Elusimicrobiota bacterium]